MVLLQTHMVNNERMKRYSVITKAIAILGILIGMSAVFGGYKLITTDGLGMPVSLLSTSPFSSYFWPGIILAVIVGGAYLLSAFLLWRQSKLAMEGLAVAGFGLLIWIFVEMYIMHQSHWLHALYFGFGIVTLVETMLLLKYREK